MLGFTSSSIQFISFLTWALQYYTFGCATLWYIFSLALAFAMILAVTTYDHDYWLNRGVFSPPCLPVVGHIKNVVAFKEQGGLCFKRIYDSYKNLRFLGTHQFFQRTLVIRDPSLIRRICVNDFQHFVDRGFFFNKDVDPLAGSVLFLRGNEWRKLRTKISPIFSPNKLRGMLPLIENTANEFVTQITKLVNEKQPINESKENKNNRDIKEHNNKIEDKNSKEQYEEAKDEKSKEQFEIAEDKNTKEEYKVDEINNIKVEGREVDSEKLVGGYTADAIVPCAFGLKSNVMENDNDPFAVALAAFYETSWYNLLEKTMRQFWPSFVLFFKMRIIPKKTHDFFYNIVTKVLKAREKGEQEKRGDFIDMMMSLRNDDNNNNCSLCPDDDVEITDMVISANAFIIFLGGFETTSSTLAFLLLELAHDQKVQDKLREEILRVTKKYEGKISYGMLQELGYMEMVIQETLRLYPPFPSIQRICTKDYQIPDSDVVVERGTIVLFPTLGIQRDSQYFEAADEFIPERWAEDEPAPPVGVYMPFGDGPRYCIGKRFAMVQMKCCLVRLLAAARVSPAPRASPRHAPFTPDPRSPLTLHPRDSKLTLSLL